MQNKPGQIQWRDLTVEDASEVASFYEQVVGWTRDPVSMGDYDDFGMKTADGEVVAGICHSNGPNRDLPAMWLPYINVEDLETRIKTCEQLGGKLIDGPRKAGGGMMAIIQDPVGAVVGLYEHSVS